jgi:hypothetical protein
VIAALAAACAITLLRYPPARGAQDEPVAGARATLLVSAPAPKVLHGVGEREPDPKTFRQTQAALIKSRLVLAAAVQDPEIAKLELLKGQADPVEWLARRLEVAPIDDSELIRVSIRAQRAEGAKVVNAVVHAYLRVVVETEHERLVTRQKQLQEIHAKFQESLMRKRETLRNAVESGSQATDDRDPESHRQMLMRELGESRMDLRRTRLQRVAVESRLKYRQALEKDPDAARSKARLELQEELDVLRKQEQTLGEEQAGLARDIKALERERQSAKRGVLDASLLQSEIDVADTAFKRIAEEIEALNVEMAGPPRIRVIDLAEPR